MPNEDLEYHIKFWNKCSYLFKNCLYNSIFTDPVRLLLGMSMNNFKEKYLLTLIKNNVLS